MILFILRVFFFALNGDRLYRFFSFYYFNNMRYDLLYTTAAAVVPLRDGVVTLSSLFIQALTEGTIVFDVSYSVRYTHHDMLSRSSDI